MNFYYKCLFSALSITAFSSLAASALAAPIDVDGTNYTTLSAAVAAAYATGDVPAVVNLNVAALPTADGTALVLDRPININGMADTGTDILVSYSGIQAGTRDADALTKPYIKISSPSDVSIKNLKLHLDSNGQDRASDDFMVTGVRCTRPANVADVATYTFTNVQFSGSASGAAKQFVPLDSGADLFSATPIKWSGKKPNGDALYAERGLVQLDAGAGAGTYNTVFDHCKMGLTFGTPININAVSGTHKILGGVYGHSGRDAIQVQSTTTGTATVTIAGTHDDRVRVVRSTNTPAQNSHGIDVKTGANIDRIEYVDIRGVETANGMALQGGHIQVIRHVRVMGKFTTTTNNHAVYITAAAELDLIDSCTFHGNSSGNFGYVPLQFQPGVPDIITVKDTILSSDYQSPTVGGTVTVNTDATSVPLFQYCAIPTDGTAGESLLTPPVTGTAADGVDITTCISSSPMYDLGVDAYDWSDNQGAGQPGNAVGNANVLRPTNPLYETAGSGNNPLYGGAGIFTAGIDASEWMLM